VLYLNGSAIILRPSAATRTISRNKGSRLGLLARITMFILSTRILSPKPTEPYFLQSETVFFILLPKDPTHFNFSFVARYIRCEPLAVVAIIIITKII
jgi:hypothetical protein